MTLYWPVELLGVFVSVKEGKEGGRGGSIDAYLGEEGIDVRTDGITEGYRGDGGRGGV